MEHSDLMYFLFLIPVLMGKFLSNSGLSFMAKALFIKRNVFGIFLTFYKLLLVECNTYLDSYMNPNKLAMKGAG